jgi:hypothetical protein
MKALEVRVLQALLHSVALFRVEYQHLSKQIERHRIGFRVETRPALLIALYLFADVLASKVVANETHVLVRRSAQHCNSPFDLVEVVISREKGCPAKQLSENAANRPYIQCVRVMRSIENDFRSSVPTSNHVFCEGCSCFFIASC